MPRESSVFSGTAWMWRLAMVALALGAVLPVSPLYAADDAGAEPKRIVKDASIVDLFQHPEKMDLATVLGGNTLFDWLIAVGIFAATFTALFLLRGVARRLIARAATTTNKLDDLAAEMGGGTKFFFMLLIAVYFGSLWLVLPPDAKMVMQHLAAIALILQVAYWGQRALKFFVAYQNEKYAESDNASSFNALGYLGRLVLWSAVFLLVLDNLGVDITALIATLGVGGIAIALATQSILGDLFASLVIMLDRPFVVGDFIIVGDFMGTVDRVGLKTTRVKALSGEQIVFSNADLLASRVRNFKRMQERRAAFTLGVTYQTTADQLAEIPGIVRGIVVANEGVRFDRCHFKGYGDFALLFETVYYVLDRDYNKYMDIQQAINLAIFRAFEEKGIAFAYPTQTLYVQKVDDARV